MLLFLSLNTNFLSKFLIILVMIPTSRISKSFRIFVISLMVLIGWGRTRGKYSIGSVRRGRRRNRSLSHDLAIWVFLFVFFFWTRARTTWSSSHIVFCIVIRRGWPRPWWGSIYHVILVMILRMTVAIIVPRDKSFNLPSRWPLSCAFIIFVINLIIKSARFSISIHRIVVFVESMLLRTMKGFRCIPSCTLNGVSILWTMPCIQYNIPKVRIIINRGWEVKIIVIKFVSSNSVFYFAASLKNQSILTAKTTKLTESYFKSFQKFAKYIIRLF